MKLEIGKKYRVRNASGVKYVEIIGTYEGQHRYDFEGSMMHTAGDTENVIYTSEGSFLASGSKSYLDLVEEYSKLTKEPLTKEV